ncbi:MAG: hypothetical protein ABI882_06465, partial [Acidobacteriota bacterium]
MIQSLRDSKAVRMVIGALILLFGVMAGCTKTLKTLAPSRGAPGEEFTLNGTGLANGNNVWKAPELLKCETTALEVVSSSDTAIAVRVPKDTPAGLYEIYAYTTPTGAAEPSKTNFLKFWVLAAPVPAEIEGAYEIQVRSFRTRYGKTAEWEDWMIANRDRYNLLFETSRKAPCPMGFAVSYQNPITYDPPWASESEHMAALKEIAEISYPGYKYEFSLSLDPTKAYVQVKLGVPENLSASMPGF